MTSMSSINSLVHFRAQTSGAPQPREVPNGAYASTGKRLLDLVLVALLLPIAVPVIAICAVMLLINGHNPFYAQLRLGQHGRVFRIWKLRTMYADADQRLQALLAGNSDLRAE